MRLRPAAFLLTVLAALWPVAPFAQEGATRGVPDRLLLLDRGETRDAVRQLGRIVRALREEVATLRDRLDAMEEAQRAALAPHLDIDGRVSSGEPRVAPAIFRLGADPRGGAASRALDADVLDRRCGDADGCLVSLGLAGVIEGGTPIEASVTLGPCILHLDDTRGAWAVSGGCDASDDGRVPGRWGRDGAGAGFSAPDREARLLLDLAGVCLFAEAPPTRLRRLDAPPELEPDRTEGLFLVATGVDWHLGPGFPTDMLPPGARFDCELTLRD